MNELFILRDTGVLWVFLYLRTLIY